MLTLLCSLAIAGPGPVLPKPAAPVVVATREILPGEMIENGDLEVLQAPGLIDIFTLKSEVAGATPTERLLSGEPIRQQRLSSGKARRIDAVVPRGVRGHAVRVVTGVDGVEPGDRVDLWWRRASTEPMCRLVQACYVHAATGDQLLLNLSPADAVRAEDADAIGELVALERPRDDATEYPEARCPLSLSR